MSVSSVNATSNQLYQSLFNALDKDASGGITLQEIQAASAGATDEKAADLLGSLDTDSDGVVSQSEMKTARQTLSAGLQDELLSLQAAVSAAAADLLATLYDGLGNASADAAAGGTAAATTATGSSTASTVAGGEQTSSNDPADLNRDGVVTEAERLIYESMMTAGEEAGSSAWPPTGSTASGSAEG